MRIAASGSVTLQSHQSRSLELINNVLINDDGGGGNNRNNDISINTSNTSDSATNTKNNTHTI